jgi:hypothetical protein
LKSVGVQGFSKETRDLKTPVGKLPDSLWVVVKLVLKAREETDEKG